jgi:hypothetical protein
VIRVNAIFVSLIVLLSLVESYDARPEYLQRYMADAFRNPDSSGCGVCHLNPQGGGMRNEFGLAFANAEHVITPLLRANFPDRFKFDTAKLPDGSVFHFADPESKSVVLERNQRKVVIDLAAATAEKKEQPLPPGNAMSFFVTSEGLGKGGQLGGLAGADRHCQALASAVGAGDRTWRAYLSTSFEDKPAVNAGDRIGPGPWHNAKGMIVGRGVSDLHKTNPLNRELALTEKGEMISAEGQPNRHDILTGSLPDGTAAVGMNCNNWSSSTAGNAMVGHHDRRGDGPNGSSWNSSHPSRGCSQEDLVQTGGAGLFYCFAADARGTITRK